MQPTSRISLVLAFSAATLPCQSGSVTAETLTRIGVHAKHPDHGVSQKTLPRGHRFSDSAGVVASSGPCRAEVRAAIVRGEASMTLKGTAASNRAFLAGTSQAFSNPQSLNGNVRCRFTFGSPTPVIGRIVVTLVARGISVFGHRGRATANVQVGNLPVVATSTSWAAPITKEFAVTLSPTGTPVTIGVEGSGTARFGQLSYSAEVRARFVPGAQATSYGSSCGHAWSEFPTDNVWRLTYQMGLHNSPTLLVFGAKRTSVALPPAFYGCALLVVPLAVVPGPATNGAGLATVQTTVPPGRLEFLMQPVGVDVATGRVHTTNGIDARF